ncbi:unnamed protein product [Didymodactylos carnosus]|uniref:Cyclic nucleotide-binding domain-containing protein n=1 Tax=Didymodactylos carnosus TaxID=1234261 RepID=A0A813PEQ0_9BILA|nr:unnamed protein product [Didymodactylos carnosus]CAF3533027.1 unnamed protein product [Didymodactylos carnosus]
MASAFKSIRYQACDSNDDNNNNELVSISTSTHGSSKSSLQSKNAHTNTNQKFNNKVSNSELCGVTILPSTTTAKQTTTPSPCLPALFPTLNNKTSSLTHLLATASPSESPPTRNNLTTQVPTADIEHKPRHTSSQLHAGTSVFTRTGSRQSILDTLSNKFTTVRKSSTSAFTSAQQHLSQGENINLFSQYQGDYIRQSRQLRKARRQDIKARFEKFQDGPLTKRRTTSRRFTFIFDPSGRLTYWWTSIVSIAFLYNFWVIIYRFSFHELNHNNILVWFIFDYVCDLIYIFDIAFNFRTAYLEEGVLQTDPIKLRHYYMNTTRFYIDCLCLMPLDFLYLSIGFKSIVRLFRLVKIYRFWTFLDRTERHTNYPNLFRAIVMIHYLLAIFHWNACLIYILNTRSKMGLTKRFNFTFNDIGLDYFKALYWSTSTLTLTDNYETKPTSKEDFVFMSIELVFALLLFATIMGHVASIVANLTKLDAVKTYMSLRRLPNNLEDRVIRWFDYLWMSHKSVDDNHVLSLLPYKLRAEIAIHVHLDTLKRVEIFQNTEAGFLNELVLRLEPVLFSPGDFICRKGEVGKEMYIVNRGKLHVMADNGKTVLATLKAGSYFGEISILNMGTSGNRRTASVRSVGYSDLFCLSKEDLWEVLKEYPAVRVKLEAIAVKRLEKHKKPLIQQVNMKRSKSTPGLVEASTRLPFIVPMRRTGSGAHRLSSIRETDVHAVGLPFDAHFSTQQQHPQHRTQATIGYSCAGLSSLDRKQPQTTNLSSSVNSLAAPLASSISVTSSLNSHYIVPNSTSHRCFIVDQQHQQTKQNQVSPVMMNNFSSFPETIISVNPIGINHSMSWSNGTNSRQSPTTLSNLNRSCSHWTTNRNHLNNKHRLESITDKNDSSSNRTQTILIEEIQYLRQRLKQLEEDNVSLNTSLKQKHWELKNRLRTLEKNLDSTQNNHQKDLNLRESFSTETEDGFSESILGENR